MSAFTTKKTTAGIASLAAAGLLAVGVAMPATADTTSVDNSERTSATDTTTSILDSIEAILNGGDITGGITGGDPAISENSLGGSISDLVGGVGVDGLVGDVTGGDVTNSSPIVVAPQTGDIASGTEVGNGNAVGSGNDVSAPIGSGNTTNVDLGDVTSNVSDLSDVTGDVSDLVDVTDVVDVNGLVEDVTNSVDVDGIVSDVTGSLSSILGR